MKLLIPAAFLALVAVAGVILAARDLVHRQNHTAHVATVAVNKATSAAAKTATKVAKVTAAKTAVKVKRQTQAEINRKIVLSQLNACRRGKKKNAQLNYDTDLIRSFMLQAVAALKAKPDAASQARAKLYQGYADHLLDIPQVNCMKVIYKP